MKKRIYDLRSKVMNSRMGKATRRYYLKAVVYVTYPYHAVEKRYLQYKSDKLERQWVERVFLWRPRTSHGNGASSGMSLDMLEDFVQTTPSLAALKAQVVAECDKMVPLQKRPVRKVNRRG